MVVKVSILRRSEMPSYLAFAAPVRELECSALPDNVVPQFDHTGAHLPH
jgi:hypothetical protein